MEDIEYWTINFPTTVSALATVATAALAALSYIHSKALKAQNDRIKTLTDVVEQLIAANAIQEKRLEIEFYSSKKDLDPIFKKTWVKPVNGKYYFFALNSGCSIASVSVVKDNNPGEVTIHAARPKCNADPGITIVMDPLRGFDDIPNFDLVVKTVTDAGKESNFRIWRLPNARAAIAEVQEANS